MADALIAVAPIRRFAGIELITDRIPDESTILSFRHLLEKHVLGQKFLNGQVPPQAEVMWIPETEPALMRASLPARLAKRSPMKRKRHKLEQIIRKLRIAEQLLNQGQNVPDVSRALEVSAPTYYRRQQLYGGMKATEAKRL